MIETVEKTQIQASQVMDILQIMQFVPHRYPFLLIDRITEFEPGKHIKGYKNITNNEPFFQGHFPNNPIMPGVLIIEAMAQIGCIVVANMPEGQNKLAMLSGIDKARFRRPVLPGDRLDLEAEMLRIRPQIGKAFGRAMVNGELAAEGEILFALVPQAERNGKHG